MDPPAERLLTPRFGVVVGSGLAYFLSLGMLLPVIPRYVQHRLGGGSVGVGVAVGALFVGALILRPYAGRIGDRIGRRQLIVVGALVVGVAALLYGAVSSLGFLIAARLLAGVGEASDREIEFATVKQLDNPQRAARTEIELHRWRSVGSGGNERR